MNNEEVDHMDRVSEMEHNNPIVILIYFFFRYYTKMAEPKVKRKREDLSEQEKNIFWNTLKHSDNGKNWKIIYESTRNNAKKHDAWEKVTEHFNHVTNRTRVLTK